MRIIIISLACMLQIGFHCYAQKPLLADTDTVYNAGSGIQIITVDSNKVKMLTNLGMLWGFIKYYHAHVNEGAYNMDAELFRILPKILAAETPAKANKIMEEWVDHFGKPVPCPKCRSITRTKDVKLMPDYGYLFDENNFSKTFRNKLDYIKQNRSVKSKHYYISLTNIGNPVFEHETAYKANAYPDAGLRLLALYRYWNMIQYFYPDRHLIGEDWNKVLGELIPEFCSAKDTLAYNYACLHMVSRLHDTHAQIRETRCMEQAKGIRLPPIGVTFAEQKLVVVHVKDTLGIKDKIKPGDIIEKINGVSIETLISRYLPETPASNYSTQLYYMVGQSFLRTNDTVMHFDIKRGNEQLHLTLFTLDPYKNWYSPHVYESDTSYKMLDGNIGYIYPEKLKGTELDNIKTIMKYTKGIVIDMRCYPGIFMPFSYGNWLKKGTSRFAQFSEMSTDIPGRCTLSGNASNGCDGPDCYYGKLVIIVNAAAVSQSEYTVMALAGPNTTVIGDTTAGADGNVSQIVLPGNLITRISGIGIMYPDGTETQRVGIKIDKIVRPSIKGIAEGRDDLLESALNYIKESK